MFGSIMFILVPMVYGTVLNFTWEVNEKKKNLSKLEN